MENELKVIVRALEKSRQHAFIGLITASVLVISIPFLALIELEENVKLFRILLVLSFLLFGSLLLVVIRRYRRLMDPGNSPIVEAINTPGSVVWFYEKEAGQSHLIYLHLKTGKYEYFQIEEADIQTVLDALEKKLPAAVRGYSRENKKRYKEDPAGFGKNIQ